MKKYLSKKHQVKFHKIVLHFLQSSVEKILKRIEENNKIIKSPPFGGTRGGFAATCLLILLSLQACDVFKTIQTPQKPKETTFETDSVQNQTATIDTVKKIPQVFDKEPIYKTKEKYSIGLALPFSIEKNIDTTFNSSLDSVLSFFEGFKMAVDSLEKIGLNAEIKVFDTKNNRNTIDSLLNLSAVQEMDLWILKLRNQYEIYVKGEHDSLQKAKYNIVPDLLGHVTSAANYIENDFFEKKITVIQRKGKAFDQQVGAKFLEFLKEKPDSAWKANNIINVDSEDKIKGDEILEKLDSETINVIYMPIPDEAIVSVVLRELRKECDNYNIIVFGLPNWKDFKIIDPEYYEKFQILITASFNIDYENPANGLWFRANFADQYEMEPHPEAYKGFDIALYFGSLLNDYGNSLNQVVEHEKKQLLHNNFSFLAQDSTKTIFKNQGVNILKFKDYGFQKQY